MEISKGTNLPLADALQKISELELEQEGLITVRDEFQQMIGETQAKINEHKNMLQPIGALTDETLYIIFHNVVSFVPGDLQANPYPMPLMLAAVCRRWRCIMLSNRRFWTHILLDHFRDHDLHSYVSYSNDMMLDISFLDHSHSESGKGFKGISKALQTLGQAAHRWRNLQVNVTNATDKLAPLWTQPEANSLEYVRIVAKHGVDGENVRPTFPVHQDKLHTLILIRVGKLQELVAPNLQYLVYVGAPQSNCQLSLKSLSNLLSPATKLQTLRLYIWSITDSDKNEASILLPHLRHFTMYFNACHIRNSCRSGNVLANLLDMISAPALEVVELANPTKSRNKFSTYDSEPKFWDVLMVDGRPRYPTVTTAILYEVCNGVYDIQRFVEAFPDITTLSLDHRTLTLCNKFLESNDPALHPLGIQARYWEKLKCTRVHLVLDSCDDTTFRPFSDWCHLRGERGLTPTMLQFVANRKFTTYSESEDMSVTGQVRLLKTSDDYLDREAPWDGYSSC